MKLRRLIFAAATCLAATNVGGVHGHEAKGPGLEKLSTYEEIRSRLSTIEKRSRGIVKTGPLVINGDNGGLINIDRRLPRRLTVNQDVCGTNRPSPTLREAVICTLEEEGRGNRDPEMIGFSNNSRALMAARVGNPFGVRVYIITQQHGNEPAGTEAALNLLSRIARNPKTLGGALAHLDILFVIRANPDGGEPVEGCPTIIPPNGPFAGDCALTRTNLDPAAGGGFLTNTEAGFAGVVGQGYDLNRYHYVALENPIRPVENQAMVAAALAFRPDYVLDLHGDLMKTDCALNTTTLNPTGALGQLPTIECLTPDLAGDQRLFSPFAETPVLAERNTEARALASTLMRRIARQTGKSVGRFSQLQLGAGMSEGLGTSTAYQFIGALTGGWETANFTADLQPAVQAVVNGEPRIGPTTAFVDSDNLDEQIKTNDVALRVALRTIAQFQYRAPRNDRGFCKFPLATTIEGRFSPQLWGPAGADDAVSVPIAPFLPVPIFVSGECKGDRPPVGRPDQ